VIKTQCFGSITRLSLGGTAQLLERALVAVGNTAHKRLDVGLQRRIWRAQLYLEAALGRGVCR
jgi:hypothetical protein